MHSAHAHYQPLSLTRCRELAHALGDTPETAIAVHHLLRESCRAYAADSSPRSINAVVQPLNSPTEPFGFGTDAAVLWDLLQSVHGWDCINVPLSCATALGEILEAQTGRKMRYYGDIYYALQQHATTFHNDAVRLLTPNDLALLEAAPEEVRGGGFGDTPTLLAQGIVASAIVDGQIVATAHTSARSPHHADIGITTLPAWRNRGFATAAASLVACQAQQEGQTPVWSTGEDNYASQRIAHKLGFTEQSKRLYVIKGRQD